MRTRRPPKHQKNKGGKPSEATLTIARASTSGDGWTADISVPFALPGEEVRAAVRGKRADVLERLTDSPARYQAVCQHFGLPGDGCGGCTLQHWGDEGALNLKSNALLKPIRRHYPDAELHARHLSGPFSRRRAKFAVTPQGAGFYRLGGQEVVSLRSCQVVHPTIMKLINPLTSLARDLTRKIPASVDAQVTLTETGIDLALSGVGETDLSLAARERLAAFAEQEDLARLSVDGVVTAEGRPPVVTLGGVSVILPAGAFLQATEHGQNALVGEVLRAAEGAKRVADLFCGIGTFALPLSQASTVLAVEGHSPAARTLQEAATREHRPVTSVTRDLFSRPMQAIELEDIDAAVFDPPRAGALHQARALVAARVPVIIAVSCNPATLARDASAFVNDYDLVRLVMIDQFGWSPHVEAVAVFHRRV